MKSSFAALALVLFASGASAGVTDVAANGFTIEIKQQVGVPPDKLYAVLVEPSWWWSSAHTFSDSAANLSLETRAGGCFCEKLPSGGSVQHMQVISVMPGKMLRLTGMLGPFQGSAGSGVMTWTFEPAAGGTKLTLTYQIAGTAGTIGGKPLDVWSKAADGMLSEQVARLKRMAETGKAE